MEAVRVFRIVYRIVQIAQTWIKTYVHSSVLGVREWRCAVKEVDAGHWAESTVDYDSTLPELIITPEYLYQVSYLYCTRYLYPMLGVLGFIEFTQRACILHT